MTDAETQALLLNIQEGNEAAFSQLYNHWKKKVYQFAWQMTGSTSTAEDITQDVFLLLIRNKLHFSPAKGSFVSFLYGVARNLSLKAARKDRQLQELHDPLVENTQGPADPLLQLTSSESTARVRQCILSLPPQYREVVILCDLHEMSYAEAGEVTGSAIGTVRSRLHRGRDLLLQKLRAPETADQKSTQKGAHYEIPAL